MRWVDKWSSFQEHRFWKKKKKQPSELHSQQCRLAQQGPSASRLAYSLATAGLLHLVTPHVFLVSELLLQRMWASSAKFSSSLLCDAISTRRSHSDHPNNTWDQYLLKAHIILLKSPTVWINHSCLRSATSSILQLNEKSPVPTFSFFLSFFFDCWWILASLLLMKYS